MVDGLYANYANPRDFTQVGDFATIVHRQQALGFNAVRLPFRFVAARSLYIPCITGHTGRRMTFAGGTPSEMYFCSEAKD